MVAPSLFLLDGLWFTERRYFTLVNELPQMKYLRLPALNQKNLAPSYDVSS
jgi:hypothetical protein